MGELGVMTGADDVLYHRSVIDMVIGLTRPGMVMIVGG